ncbi:hypothetical protein Peur_058788 [Populus x canadensis]
MSVFSMLNKRLKFRTQLYEVLGLITIIGPLNRRAENPICILETLIPDPHHLYKYFCCCHFFFLYSSTQFRLLHHQFLPHAMVRDEKFTIKVFSNNWFVRQSPSSEEQWHLAKLPSLLLCLLN